MSKKNNNAKPSAQRYRQRMRQQAQAVPLPADLTADQFGAQAALFVGSYRQQHGTGPTWTELAAHLHPDCGETCGRDQPGAIRWHVIQGHQQQLVQQLIKAGWLTARRKPRSLAVAR